MSRKKTDYKQTHLNRYYSWKILRTIATPPPDEFQRLSAKEYAKISRKEIKKIFSERKEKTMYKCSSCGKKVSESANFCKYCGKKVKDICSYCWVRKKDNYNCGESNCPGYNLFRLEKSKSE